MGPVGGNDVEGEIGLPTIAQSDHGDAEATVRQIASAHAGVRGALLPLLHSVQDRLGHIPAASVPIIAETLNLSRAEVHGVVSFYHDFRAEPAGNHVVKLCRAEACQARGGAAIEAAAAELLGVAMGETSADRRVTLEAVYCLGLCATGPNALVDGKPVSRIDRARLDQIVAKVLA